MTKLPPRDDLDAPHLAQRAAAVDWLMGRINYERAAVLPYNERQLKLDRMRQLLTRLGAASSQRCSSASAPDAGLKMIHIAGTKGKGSTATLLASMLAAAGLKTGVYSSPHLDRIEERWAIDGQRATAEQLVRLVERVRPVVEAMDAETDAHDPEGNAIGPPTFFDITTAMALVHFEQQQCDAVVLEVGLGGRLDSTNVCLPVVSVITSISLDHTKQLGDTLGKIAAEKAGIIKPGVPVVSGVVEDEPRAVIARVAREHGCRLIERERQFGATDDSPHRFWREAAHGRETIVQLQLGLPGRHQVANAAVALAVVGELRDQGWAISDDACRRGLASARAPARVEMFAGAPRVVVDAAHNRASAEALVATLQELTASGAGASLSEQHSTLLLAVSRDKDVEAICTALASGKFKQVIATRYVDNLRAVEPQTLKSLMQRAAPAKGSQVIAMSDPIQAWQHALRTTPSDGMVVITGSFFIAAELRPLVLEHAAR